MRQLLIIGFIILNCAGFSQSSSCNGNDYNRANPRDFLNEVHDLRIDGQYDSIISRIETELIKDSVIKPYHYHQLSCYYALKRNYNKSFMNLYKALHYKLSINDVLTDTDIELLYNLPEWKNVKDTIIAIYLRKNLNITDASLSLKLWQMGIEDQRYRTLRGNNKRFNLIRGSSEYDSMSEVYSNKIKNNLSFIKELVHNKKWPLYSEVGNEAGDAAFLIVQHSGNIRLIKRALKLIKIAVRNDEASKSSYVMMLDRYLMYKKKKQIYGTQARRYSKGIDKNGKSIIGKMFLWPIEDEINVSKRRKEMGMNSIQENSKRLGIEYEYIPEHETMKCKTLVKFLKKNSLE